MACHPRQASSNSAGFRPLAIRRVRSSRSRQTLAPGGQYLPLPYVPSMEAAMRVSSSLSLGSTGVARVSDSFSSLILRATSAGQLERIEPRGFLRQVDGGVDEAFIGLGGQGLGVVGDVGGLDPVGALALDRQRQQPGLGVCDELLR